MPHFLAPAIDVEAEGSALGTMADGRDQQPKLKEYLRASAPARAEQGNSAQEQINKMRTLGRRGLSVEEKTAIRTGRPREIETRGIGRSGKI